MTRQGLNKKEIQVLAETSRGNYSIRIYSEVPDLWQVDIMMANSGAQFQAFTQRGEVKTWRELAGAVGYVQDTCPDCQDVKISVGDWTFSRAD